MKTSQNLFLCAAVIACSLPSCSPPTEPTARVQVSSPIGSDRSLAGQVFQEVNSYRATKGKAPLIRHAGLDRLAQEHCNHLVKTRGSYGLHGSNVSHVGFEGRAALAQHKYRINSIGENVVSSTTKSASHLVKLWSNSKSHEYNMRGGWTSTGVATAITPDGSVISTQIFGTSPGVGANDHANKFNGFR